MDYIRLSELARSLKGSYIESKLNAARARAIDYAKAHSMVKTVDGTGGCVKDEEASLRQSETVQKWIRKAFMDGFDFGNNL